MARAIKPTLAHFTWIDWECAYVYPGGKRCREPLTIRSSGPTGIRWGCPRATFTEAGVRDYMTDTFLDHEDASTVWGIEPPGWAHALLKLARRQDKEIRRLKRWEASMLASKERP